MTEFTVIQTPENQPYFSFFHLEQEYFIWLWLSDGGPSVSSACLSVPLDKGDGIFLPNNVLTESAYKAKVEAAGGTQEFMRDIFIPKVNNYLSAQGGGDTGFPSGDIDMQQFNWIVENSLSYNNDKVSITI